MSKADQRANPADAIASLDDLETETPQLDGRLYLEALQRVTGPNRRERAAEEVRKYSSGAPSVLSGLTISGRKL